MAARFDFSMIRVSKRAVLYLEARLKTYTGRIRFFRTEKPDGICIDFRADSEATKVLFEINIKSKDFLDAFMDANHDEDFMANSYSKCECDFHEENVAYLGKVREIKYEEFEVDQDEKDWSYRIKQFEVDGWELSPEHNSKCRTGNPNRAIAKVKLERWVDFKGA